MSLDKELESLLSTFSKSDKALSEARQKREIFSVTVDTYEALDYPIVRHTFYGRTEEEAFGYMEAHKETDRWFREAQRGSFDGIQCKNTRALVRKVQPAKIRATGLPKPSMLRKDAIKGDFAKKLGL